MKVLPSFPNSLEALSSIPKVKWCASHLMKSFTHFWTLSHYWIPIFWTECENEIKAVLQMEDTCHWNSSPGHPTSQTRDAEQLYCQANDQWGTESKKQLWAYSYDITFQLPTSKSSMASEKLKNNKRRFLHELQRVDVFSCQVWKDDITAQIYTATTQSKYICTARKLS